MKIENWKKLEYYKIRQINREIDEYIDRFELRDGELYNLLIVYCAYFIEECFKEDFVEKAELGEKNSEILKEIVTNHRDFLKHLTILYKPEEFARYILSVDRIGSGRNYGIVSTPESMIKLGQKILKINKGDEVLDIFCGMGDFIKESYLREPDAKFTGVEMDSNLYNVAIMKNNMLGSNWELKNENIFRYSDEKKYDKIFSMPPLDEKSYVEEEKIEDLSDFTGLSPEELKKLKLGWYMNLLLLMAMKEEGKALAVMTNEAVGSEGNRNIIKWFIDRGYIETLIRLPERVLEFSTIPCTIIVLSKNNHGVNMIDASDLGKILGRQRVLTDDEIDDIVKCIGRDTSISTFVENKKIAENDYDLHPIIYTERLTEMENCKELNEISRSVRQGLQMRAENFEKLKSRFGSRKQYITVSEIIDGGVEIRNNYLNEIPEELKKYTIKDKNILVSKTATPFFKAGIVKLPPNKEILASGNIYIIDIDEAMANPYYVQAFLMSDMCQKSLKILTRGSKLGIITLRDLRKLVIPLPPREIQNKIGERYARKLQKLRSLKAEYELVEIALHGCCEEYLNTVEEA